MIRLLKSLALYVFLFLAAGSVAWAATIPSEMKYSSYLGGNGEDRILYVHTDANGYVYLVGETNSTNLPEAVNALTGNDDAFIIKLDTDGESILYSRYFGGSNFDGFSSVTVDDDGNAYATGSTWSSNIPLYGTPEKSTISGTRDVIMVKFDSSGNPVYSTYYGGPGWEYGLCIDRDPNGAIYVGGFSHYSYPTTTGAYQEDVNDGSQTDGFVTKFVKISDTEYKVGADGPGSYSTNLGGEYHEPVDEIRVVADGSGGYEAYVIGGAQSRDFPTYLDTSVIPLGGEILDPLNNSVLGSNLGADGYFTRLNSTGSALIYSTFWGPEQSPLFTSFSGMDVDKHNNVYCVGQSSETAYPFINVPAGQQSSFGGGTYDGVFLKIDANYQSASVVSASLGGSGYDVCSDVAVDNTGYLWLAGFTNSTDWPNTSPEGNTDLWLFYMQNDGKIIKKFRIGGSGADGHLINDSNYGNVSVQVNKKTNMAWVSGITQSTNFPVVDKNGGTSGVYQSTNAGGTFDGFYSVLEAPAVPLPWVDEFDDQEVDDVPGGWEYKVNHTADRAVITINSSSTAKLAVNSGQWGKVQSRRVAYDAGYPWLRIKVNSKTHENGGSYWEMILRDAEDLSDSVTVISHCTKSGTFEINYVNALSSKSWSEMVIELTLTDWDGDGNGENMVIDHVGFYSTQLFENLNPPAAVMGHVMLTYLDGSGMDGLGGDAWHGWRWDHDGEPGYDAGYYRGGQDADPSDPTHNDPADYYNKREIASVYYPYSGTADSYEPGTNPPNELDAPYNQSYNAMGNPTMDKQMEWMQMLGLDGLIFDLGNYYKNDGGVLVIGTPSWHVAALGQYLGYLRANTRKTILVYEDKAQWDWVTDNTKDRAFRVAQAKADLTNWLNMMWNNYSDVQYMINGRPVIGIYSYHDQNPNPASQGPARLSAEDLKNWKEDWAANHSGVEPIILTNLRYTVWPYTPDDASDDANELETADVKYTDVIDGIFEWPEFWGDGSFGQYDEYHDLDREKEKWETGTDNINGQISRDLNNRRYRMVVGGAWPGFDDGVTQQWGAGVWRKIPRYDDSLGEYTLDYHLGRIGAGGQNYSLKQVATFNDWAEGTNIEPANEFSVKYTGSGVVNPFTEALKSVRDAIGVEPGTTDLGLPMDIYAVRKEFAGDSTAQTAADNAHAAVMQGQYSTAASYIATYVDQIESNLPTPTNTPTITPTPTPSPSMTHTSTPTPITGQTLDVFWREQFFGTAGYQPAGWTDETENSNLNVEIAYSSTPSLAMIARTAEDSWGKVQSPVLTVNPDVHPMVKVKVDTVSQYASWKLLLRKGEDVWVLQNSTNATGTFDYNYRQITGLIGPGHAVTFEWVVESSQAGQYILVDDIQVYGDNSYTPTPTPSHTMTCTESPTITVSPTVTPTPSISATSTITPTVTFTSTPTPVINIYLEDFIGTANAKVNGWVDETDVSAFNAYARYASSYSVGSVKKTTDDVWGKVLSEAVECDVSLYKYVTVRVLSITPGKTWKIGIQEEENSWTYWDLNTSSGASGIFEFDITAVTGWSGTHRFSIQITVEGDQVDEVEALLDYVRVHRAEVGGSAVYWGLAIEPTAAPSMTPTPTQTITTSPTFTPTITPTQTPGPWLAEKKVMAYPNPARGKVNFAYTIAGEAKVVIDIYKLTGERVANITEHVNGGAGQTLSTAWDAVDVAPGIYFCRIVITDNSGKEEFKINKKVALIK